MKHPGADMTERLLPQWLTPSVAALVLANLVPVYGVIALEWDVFVVVMLFWLENVIVGVSTVLKMLCVDPGEPLIWIGKVFAIGFFCFHYGVFTGVHGVFVIALFGGGADKLGGLPTVASVLKMLGGYHLWYAAAALVLSHASSFAWNYLGKGEYRRATITQLMARPYGRVVVLHVAIIAGGFLVMGLKSPIAALLLLIALKIGMDIRAHLREHAKAADGAPG